MTLCHMLGNYLFARFTKIWQFVQCGAKQSKIGAKRYKNNSFAIIMFIICNKQLLDKTFLRRFGFFAIVNN